MIDLFSAAFAATNFCGITRQQLPQLEHKPQGWLSIAAIHNGGRHHG
ncbi:hypothetical protein [Bradyrhizobium sp. CER78]|nr:hypothetical protein [Bradyrhizobium sp. CER78]MDH2380102.1 hypothetical protein [Bradyrhizobium sp. CER78]